MKLYPRRRGGNSANRRGWRSLKIILEALELLKEKQKILGFERVDEPGVDVRIRKLDGTIFPLEVKSSYDGAKIHKKCYKNKCIVVSSQYVTPGDPEIVLIKILEKRVERMLDNPESV